MAVTYQKPKDDDVPWDQRLVNYGQNTNSGLDEYKRAMGVYRSKSALGDTDGASAAQKWAGQVDTAIGGIGSRPGADTRNVLETYKANTQKPMAQWSYDANNDQAYQQALQAAQRSAQTAGNNATVALGSRGIGNSQQAMTTANQIQQRSVADVNSNILPQLISQNYARFRDQQNAEMAQNDNLLKYANAVNGLDQQDLDNKFRDSQAAEQKKQSNWNAYLQSVGLSGDMGTGAKDDYSLLGSKTGNLSLQGQQQKNAYDQQQYVNQFNEKQTAFDNKMKQAQMAQQAQQFAASQGIQWANLNQRQKEFVSEQAMKQQQLDAQNNPNNLDNKYKQAQIDALTQKNAQSANPGIDEYDLSMIDTLAANKGVDISKPETIKPFIAELKTQYGWTTNEAKQVESYLSSKVGTSQGSSSFDLFPSLSMDSIRNNLQGGLSSFNGLLDKLPGGGSQEDSSQGYFDYLKELAKKSNPLNLFK